MSTSPILSLPQVAPNQNQKELTINSALAILEAASNDSLIVSAAGGNVALTEDQWTKYFMFRVQGHAVLRSLMVYDRPRFFVVSNEGSAPLYVTPTGSASNHVEVPAGKIVLMATDGDLNIRAVSTGVTNLTDLGDVITTPVTDGMVLGYVGSQDAWVPVMVGDLLDAVVAFTDLSDVPSSYTGFALKALRVNAGATGLEFYTPTTPFIPYTLSQLSDVELATGLTEGDVLTYRDGIWQTEAPLTGVTTFLGLTDTPSTYEPLQIVRVNAGGTALEYHTLPMIPTQLGHLSDVEQGTGVTDGDILRYRDGVWQPEPFPASSGGGASSFISLSDVPGSYAGAAGRLVRVNAGASGLEFYDLPMIPTQLNHLADVELATGVSDGDTLRYRDGIWQTEAFVMSFKDLSDTPDYTNSAGKLVRINDLGNGITYYTLPMIPTQLAHLTDVEQGTGVTDGDVLRYRDGVWQPEPFERNTTTTIANDYVNDLTLGLAHVNNMVPMNKASGVNVTVPTNASVAFPLGSSVNLVQKGAGQITVVAAGGVTIEYPSDMTLVSRTQWSVLTLLKIATDTWLLFGDLVAA